jgi:hypothetical protein
LVKDLSDKDFLKKKHGHILYQHVLVNQNLIAFLKKIKKKIGFLLEKKEEDLNSDLDLVYRFKRIIFL